MTWSPGSTLRNRQFLDALDLCYNIARHEPRTVSIQELPAYVKGVIQAQREALLKPSQLPPESVVSLYSPKCAKALKPLERIKTILRAEFTRRIDEEGDVAKLIDWVVHQLAQHMYQLELMRRVIKEVVAAEDSLIELADDSEGSSYLLAEPIN